MTILFWFTKLTKGESQRTTSVESTKRPTWVIDESKYLGMSQVRRLRRHCETDRVADHPEKTYLYRRDWFMVELGLQCGLRVSEMAHLRVGDLSISNGDPSLIVRMGKGGKTRIVHFSQQFRQACLSFLSTKTDVGQIVDKESYVLTRADGRGITKRTLQKAFKNCLKGARISSHHAIHCLRHTYGTHLYKVSGYNLRLVQEQLGHASINTTQVYANLFSKDVRRSVEKLYQSE